MRIGQIQNRDVVLAVEGIARPVLTGLGLSLVSCEFQREATGWVLRLYIEGLGGAPVSVEDCTRGSREVGALLDAAAIPELDAARYSLEVSSPGIERPLTESEDFVRFRGQRARVRLAKPQDGSRNFVGRLRGIEDDAIVLECDGSRVVALPVKNVARACLAPEG
ncbi:MAG: ribosome maturation factor RimP [Deltaproteobacteria bacterium]|nr:ribosome maturation factor RimP [Deltaproteobacteria bacterium]